MVSVVVPQFLCNVQGVNGVYGVPQCLMVSVVVPSFLCSVQGVLGVCGVLQCPVVVPSF